MAKITITNDAATGLAGASEAIKTLAALVWDADVLQIETGVNARVTDLATARQVIALLLIVAKGHEQRIRQLERLAASIEK